MANYEINEEQEVLTKAMRMIETGDPVHADVYNVLFSALLNNDVFLEKLANKMVQQAMISHVMDSTNSNMVLGADQGPVITKLIDKVQEQVTVLNTKTILQLEYVPRSFKSNSYGRTLCFNGNYYGKNAPEDIDCYYIAVDTDGIHLGYQYMGTSTIKWS